MTGFESETSPFDDIRLIHQTNALNGVHFASQECHHVAAALALLSQDEYNFMGSLSEAQRVSVAETIAALVLSTDMKEHFLLVAAFKDATDLSDRTSDSASSLHEVGGLGHLNRRRHAVLSDSSNTLLFLKVSSRKHQV